MQIHCGTEAADANAGGIRKVSISLRDFKSHRSAGLLEPRKNNLRLTKRISRRLKELMHQALGPIDMVPSVPCTVASWSKMTFDGLQKGQEITPHQTYPHGSPRSTWFMSFPKIQFEGARSVTFYYLAGLSMICFDGVWQGLLNVPFWVYWTSPYSSHYKPYT